jgi:protocatechuate 3,4-dioxygenase beta subunit
LCNLYSLNKKRDAIARFFRVSLSPELPSKYGNATRAASIAIPAKSAARAIMTLAFRGEAECLATMPVATASAPSGPLRYPGRAPHIHFKIAAPSQTPLITQMYVFGEPQNARDGVLNAIRDQRQRASVIVRLEPAEAIEPQALAGIFDIVLG